MTLTLEQFKDLSITHPVILLELGRSLYEKEVALIVKQLCGFHYTQNHPDVFYPSSFKKEDLYPIHQFCLFEPLPSSLKRCVYLPILESAPQQSMHFLLKLLEEPNSHKIQFILTTLNKKLILPTIISRCTSFTLSLISEEKDSLNDTLILKEWIKIYLYEDKVDFYGKIYKLCSGQESKVLINTILNYMYQLSLANHKNGNESIWSKINLMENKIRLWIKSENYNIPSYLWMYFLFGDLQAYPQIPKMLDEHYPQV
jgi:hypothetical protein